MGLITIPHNHYMDTVGRVLLVLIAALLALFALGAFGVIQG